jgi:two-component system, NarL family, sensor kinase
MNSLPQNSLAAKFPTNNEEPKCEYLQNELDSVANDIHTKERLEKAGCPVALSMRDRVQFETLLSDLSATFVNVPSQEVDAKVMLGLQRVVEFLGIDRSGLGQVVQGEKGIAITHSYQVEGVPPAPKVLLESQFPAYAKKIYEGNPFRLTEDVISAPEADAEREYVARTGLKAQLTIPLMASGKIVGGIGFSSFRRRIEWPAELIQRLRLVGDIFTNALARKQADEALRRLATRLIEAQEDERRRIAREMHDDWTQRLAVLGLDVAMLEKSLNDPTVAGPLLRTIQYRLAELSGDVHDLSRQLHPAILDDLGLVEAVRTECDAFVRRERIAVDFTSDTIPSELSHEQELCLYRVVQESLRNLAKHAAVSRCSVSLLVNNGFIELTVKDEGVGFDPGKFRHRAGIGIASMQERVSLVRATLTIQSSPGKGTTVLVRVPLAEAKT